MGGRIITINIKESFADLTQGGILCFAIIRHPFGAFVMNRLNHTPSML